MKHQQAGHPFDTIPGVRFSGSKWIWAANAVVANGHVLFRTKLERHNDKQQAWLFIAAESFARIFINGTEVLHTSSLSYPGQHYCETVELTGHLQEGINEIAILAWYIGVPSGASCPKDPGLLAEIVDQEGNILLASNADWRVLPLDAWQGQYRRSKWLNLDLVEILDYRKLPAGFPMLENLDGFQIPEESGYPGARYVLVEPRRFPKPTGDLLEHFKVVDQGLVDDLGNQHQIPSLAVMAERIQQAETGIQDWGDFSIMPPPAGKAWSIVLDLETYEKGFPEMIANGDPGTEIDITWYETYRDRTGQDILSKVHTSDRYILSGRDDFLHPEEWKCGRYLQLTFRKIRTALRIRRFRWKRTHYPLNQSTKITSSSKTLQRIMEISLRGAAICMHDNIMDCPWRERRQWIGDAQRIALINYYGFGDFALPRAVLKQHVQLQQTNGRMWVCLPVNEEFPTQSMEWLRAVVEYQHYSGDTSLIEETGHNISLLHRWFMGCRDPRGLFFVQTRPAVNWMDNSYGSNLSCDDSLRKYQFTTPYLAQNLRYLLFLDDVSACLSQLGQDALAEEASAERNRLAAIVRDHFWDAEHALFRDCADPALPVTFSEMGHALAVRCDLPGFDSAALWKRFVNLSSELNDIIPATPFGKHHTYEALGKLGQPEAIIQDILKWWSPMVEADSDTTWEGFTGEESRCHGWAGIPFVAILRHVLQFEPSTKGERTVSDLAGIDWIRATPA